VRKLESNKSASSKYESLNLTNRLAVSKYELLNLTSKSVVSTYESLNQIELEQRISVPHYGSHFGPLQLTITVQLQQRLPSHNR